MNDTVKIPVESVLNRLSKFIPQLCKNMNYPQVAIARSLVSNCEAMVALIKLTVDGEDILSGAGEMKIANAAKATPEYRAFVGADFIQIVHNGKVIFEYADEYD